MQLKEVQKIGLKVSLLVGLLYANFNLSASERESRVISATAGFIATTVCEGEETVFTNTSSTSAGSLVTYQWDFKDGQSSVLAEPKHVFAHSGTFNVTLTVQDSDGNFDVFSANVVVHPKPDLDFEITSANQCESTAIQFTNTSSIPAPGTITGYTWDFGDGNSASTADASHTYAAPGVYPVKLTATTASMCQQTLERSVTIHPEAVVDFAFEHVCEGNETVFINNTQIASGNVSYAWVFDDGNTSTEISPKHTYTTHGDYNVQLTATSDKGCPKSIQKSVSVYPGISPGFTTSHICLGETADFINTSTVDAGTLTYAWDFGDGSPSSTQENPSHDYANPGTYLVALTVTSNTDCEETYEKYVNVYPVPSANFSFSETCDGSAVQFNNLSVLSSGSMTYQWDFGDGNTSTDIHPSHTYALANTYQVELTVTSGFSCESILKKAVTIAPISQGGTIAAVPALCEDNSAPQTLTLSGHKGSIVRWESSTTNAEPWSSIANETTTLAYADLDVTTYYRAVVKSGACDEAYSSIAKVQIDEQSVGGAIAGTAEACINSNNGELELAGHHGSIVEWQYSTVSASTGFSSLANTSNKQSYNDIAQTTYYRAVVKNGVCNQAYSTVATISTTPETQPGLLSGAATVCKSNNSGAVSITGHVGHVLNWESSPNGLEPWTVINNQTTTLDYENLPATTFYRAVVKSGVCPQKTGNQIKIEVNENTVAGTITGVKDLCEDKADGTLELIDFTGHVIKWQSGSDIDGWNDIVNTTHTLSFTGLTASTGYRAFVQNGVCDLKTTPVFAVSIHPLPEVSFENTEVCHGLKTEFTNTSSVSSGTLEQAFWNFGDGAASVDHSPSFTFPNPGDYAVELLMTSAKGCKRSKVQSVTVNPNPSAAFTFENNCRGTETNFTNVSTLSTGSIAAYEWDFGDGASASTADPGHLYAARGKYNTSLKITSDKNCTAESIKKVTIYALPTAAFEAKDHCEGETLHFDNNSNIEDGGIFYTWNFGDGLQSTDSNPKHQYASEGEYNVSLRAESTIGRCVAEAMKTIKVHNKPHAKFTAENVCLGKDVNFKDNSDGGGDVLSYAWDFGDGNSATAASPDHRYGTAESYEVALQVSSNLGCQDTYISHVMVNPMPGPNFTVANVCDQQEAVFANLTTVSSGGISYAWDFGDGHSSGQINPKHTYATTGSYPVSLKATTSSGCEQSYAADVTIHSKPQVDFEAEAVCDGTPSSFIDKTSISPPQRLAYAWDFGDGSSSTLATPAKQYLNADEYEVRLLVTSEHGCSDTVMKKVKVFEQPMASFTVANACFGQSIRLQNKSFTNVSAMTYWWDFGDGNTSVSANPDHAYDLPKDYYIQLVVSSPGGCRDSLVRKATVYTLPEAYAGEDTTVSLGYTVQLSAKGGSTYQWTPHESLDNPNVYNPIAKPMENTTYRVTVTNEYGCIDEDEVIVQVKDDYKIVPTNVLTPDGNGQNDAWTIDNIETFGSANVVVFDRWGKTVYEKQGYENDWYGTTGGSILPDGTYYYIITFDGADQAYKGAITIIRNR